MEPLMRPRIGSGCLATNYFGRAAASTIWRSFRLRRGRRFALQTMKDRQMFFGWGAKRPSDQIRIRILMEPRRASVGLRSGLRARRQRRNDAEAEAEASACDPRSRRRVEQTAGSHRQRRPHASRTVAFESEGEQKRLSRPLEQQQSTSLKRRPRCP
jgi:hypothetical protein